MAGTALAFCRGLALGIFCCVGGHRAHSPARPSWVLQTCHVLRQDQHAKEHVSMTGWERVQAVGIVILATLAGIGTLYVGREFFIPIALALLLNALLRPLIRGLERLHVSTGVSAALVSLGLLGTLVVGGFALVNPVRAWVSQLPASFEAARRKLEPARQSLEQVSHATQALGEPSGAPPVAPAPQAASAPPSVPPFLVQLFGTTTALVAGL